jgi:hypothetical protein
VSSVSLARPNRDCAAAWRIWIPDELASVEVPKRFNAVCGIVDRWARTILVPPRSFRWTLVASSSPGSLRLIWLARTREPRRVLLDLGVGRRGGVFAMLPRIPEWCAALLGATRLGAIPPPGSNLPTPRTSRIASARTSDAMAITDRRPPCMSISRCRVWPLACASELRRTGDLPRSRGAGGTAVTSNFLHAPGQAR